MNELDLLIKKKSLAMMLTSGFVCGVGRVRPRNSYYGGAYAIYSHPDWCNDFCTSIRESSINWSNTTSVQETITSGFVDSFSDSETGFILYMHVEFVNGDTYTVCSTEFSGGGGFADVVNALILADSHSLEDLLEIYANELKFYSEYGSFLLVKNKAGREWTPKFLYTPIE